VDVLLLHYPGCSQGTNCVPTPTRRWQDSWRALEELVDQGVVHDIGAMGWYRSRG
jgi:diketogulonate reductase-like aldo/keto reductase